MCQALSLTTLKFWWKQRGPVSGLTSFGCKQQKPTQTQPFSSLTALIQSVGKPYWFSCRTGLEVPTVHQVSCFPPLSGHSWFTSELHDSIQTIFPVSAPHLVPNNIQSDCFRGNSDAGILLLSFQWLPPCLRPPPLSCIFIFSSVFHSLCSIPRHFADSHTLQKHSHMGFCTWCASARSTLPSDILTVCPLPPQGLHNSPAQWGLAWTHYALYKVIFSLTL